MTQDIREVKEIARKFLDAWKLLKYSKMYSCTTPTYQKRYDEVHLRMLLPVKIKKFSIKEVHRVNDVIHDLHAQVHHPSYEGPIMIRIRFLKEVAPYLPNKAGEWKLYPISIKQIVKYHGTKKPDNA